MIRIVAIALLVAACGSKQSAPAPKNESSAHEAEMKEHGEMPPELSKFHEVLAPRWHADKGPQRMTDTCAALPDFHANADAVAKSTPPRATNADTWTAGTKELVAAVEGLDKTCQAKDSAGFETAFQKVHETFEGLLASSGEMHGMEHHEDSEHKM